MKSSVFDLYKGWRIPDQLYQFPDDLSASCMPLGNYWSFTDLNYSRLELILLSVLEANDLSNDIVLGR